MKDLAQLLGELRQAGAIRERRAVWTRRPSRADHLAAIALTAGRAKDFTRILALLESGSVSRDALVTPPVASAQLNGPNIELDGST